MNYGIIKRIYRKKDIDSINSKIKLLGETKIESAEKFLSLRVLTTVLIGILLIIIKVKYIFIPIILIIYYNLYYYFYITKPLKLREKKLESEALVFFEVLELTLESGKNLLNSLELTCYNIESELSNEFKKSLVEVSFGKSLMESLDSLRFRIPSETISNIILNIIETSTFGNSIIESIHNQIDFLREKQIMDTKAIINRIPNKVSIISVIFIVPLILLIILGPFIIKLF